VSRLFELLTPFVRSPAGYDSPISYGF
jgi:hypothetical protein